MFKRIIDFYRVSSPSAVKVPSSEADRRYRKLRLQAFVAATFGYSLYYVCRTSLNVMKQPIIDSGVLDATRLGIIGACLYWTYAVGKFVNGFLADYCNIRKFMFTGLVISAFANFVMGMLGVWDGVAGIASSLMFVMFAVMWTLNGWSQSMGSPPAIISLSRWYPLSIRGTYYGFFSASHNFGEGLSFIFVAALVSAAGWQWGFFGASVAGALGVTLIALWLHDTPESKGLPPVEVLSGEKTQEELDAESSRDSSRSSGASETRRIQRAVLSNPGVWILALSSAFMYMSRYAINEWGMFFLQKNKGFGLMEASTIIAVNTIAGIIGTVCAGWISDTLFKGDRKWPALSAGIMEALSLVLFFYGGDSWVVNVIAMVLFGISIGVLICFVGGLMAVDLVPRRATGAALGIVGLASYAAAGLMNIISGVLIDGMATADPVTGELSYDFSYVSIFWLGAAIISFLLPILNWGRKKMEISSCD
ncbi:MAG: MFS transporter [Bacteroidales bacterium]|nr:MFS transporter [Bacteroidales bacterium]